MTPVARAMECAIAGCSKLADSGAICSMHRRRLQRGGRLEAPEQQKLSPWGRVHQAALDLANADSEDDRKYELAVARLRKAIERWYQKEGR